MTDRGKHRVGVAQHQLKVLGRQAIDQIRAFVPVADLNDGTMSFPARVRDCGARQGGNLRGHGGGHRVRQADTVGHKDRLG